MKSSSVYQTENSILSMIFRNCYNRSKVLLKYIRSEGIMKRIILILLCLASANCLAAVTLNGQVKRLYPDSGRIYFKIKNDQCESTKYYYFELSIEIEKAWYSLLLAAANSGKNVKVSVPECALTESIKIRYIYQDF